MSVFIVIEMSQNSVPQGSHAVWCSKLGAELKKRHWDASELLVKFLPASTLPAPPQNQSWLLPSIEKFNIPVNFS
jgi:hypothetical protein